MNRDEPDRLRVAQALVASDSDARLATLIRRLKEREPADDISDAAIKAEIDAVRTFWGCRGTALPCPG